MIKVLNKNDLYLALFEAFEQEATSRVPTWVPPLRKAALSRFKELGFPTRHEEEWRQTVITSLTNVAFRRVKRGPSGVTAAQLEPFTFGDLRCYQIVFVNGLYAPELSSVGTLPTGVQVRSLAEALQSDPASVEPHLARHAGFEKHTFTALNTAFLEDGAFVNIPQGVVVAEPIHLLYLSTAPGEPIVSHPRTLIVAGANSQATLIESYAGLNDEVYFTNAVTEIVVGANAVLDHYKAQRESEKAFHIAGETILMERSSVFASQSIALGGALVRNEINAILNDEGIECTLNGLYLANGKRLVDNHTTIDHAKPNCASHELYKGILDDQARGVFNGKIFVRQDAQKTDAKQTNKTLLLSDDAQINTMPQLEIYADDVKCTHGATVGQLDAEAIFYLRTRGIGEEDARAILTHAFAGAILDRIKIEAVRERLDAALFIELPRS